MKVKTFLTARLREKRDKDLMLALGEIEDGDLSELIRNGLRIVLKCDTGSKLDIISTQGIAYNNVTREEEMKKAPIKWHFPEGDK